MMPLANETNPKQLKESLANDDTRADSGLDGKRQPDDAMSVHPPRRPPPGLQYVPDVFIHCYAGGHGVIKDDDPESAKWANIADTFRALDTFRAELFGPEWVKKHEAALVRRRQPPYTVLAPVDAEAPVLHGFVGMSQSGVQPVPCPPPGPL